MGAGNELFSGETPPGFSLLSRVTTLGHKSAALRVVTAEEDLLRACVCMCVFSRAMGLGGTSTVELGSRTQDRLTSYHSTPG